MENLSNLGGIWTDISTNFFNFNQNISIIEWK